MRFYRWLSLFFCSLLGGLVLTCIGVMRSPYGKGAGGVVIDREYYVYSPSSQAKIVDSVSLSEYFFLTGERYTLCFPTVAAANDYALCLLEEKGARMVFEEEIAGVRCIYAYMDNGREGVLLFGGRVNLHVAVRDRQVQVGTPMIFGGY